MSQYLGQPKKDYFDLGEMEDEIIRSLGDIHSERKGVLQREIETVNKHKIDSPS